MCPGRLKPQCDSLDALMAVLPAGTLSGAPKVRAMELIDSLEQVKRGVYGGTIGYLGFDGNLDTCICIRTALYRHGKAYVQAGAGIVADSSPGTGIPGNLQQSGSSAASHGTSQSPGTGGAVIDFTH